MNQSDNYIDEKTSRLLQKLGIDLGEAGAWWYLGDIIFESFSSKHEVPAFTSQQLFDGLPEWTKAWIKYALDSEVILDENEAWKDITSEVLFGISDIIQQHFPGWTKIWSEMHVYLKRLEPK